MIKDYILKHIQDYSIDDLRYLADSYSIVYSEEELSIIYSFLKKHYLELLDGKEDVLQSLQGIISPSLYTILLSTYKTLKRQYL